MSEMTAVAALAVMTAAAATMAAAIAAALLGGLRRRARHERNDGWRWEVVPASRRWWI
jgi:hypothetical protein